MKRRVLSFIIALVLCLNLCPIRALAVGEGTDGGLCLHHPLHTDECGYVPESPDAPCTFACRICTVEDLIRQLPDSVSESNREQVQLQLSEIGALYDGLTVEEQQQVDLSLCISLQEQLDGISLAALSDDLGGISSDGVYDMKDDISDSEPYLISELVRISTNGYTLTITNSPAIQVNGTGKLHLTGKVTSETGTGVEVLSGGYLSITGADTLISGKTCALNIASGAEVHLSGGTYSGRYAAIQTADNNFAALLEAGCAYFDGSGKLLLPAEATDARIIVIGQCPGHSGKTSMHTPGTTTHTWACPYCGAGETEACTFTFDQNGNGTCGFCKNTVAIAVDERGLTNLVYDGTVKPEDVKITVTLTDGSNKVLVKDTDYKVVYEPRKDAGEITVTVTGNTFHGTFTKTYTVAQDKPGLSWANSNPITANYDGAPVEAGDLPGVNINIQSKVDNLQSYLQYSYRKQGDTDYTDGLPKDAGTYEVVVSLPVLPNFEGAVSDPITLTIDPINPIAMAPAAKTPTYNGNLQVLVTAGTLDPAAAADGLTIEFATEEKGTYSTEIPSATNAGDYTVWYQVVGLTNNYIAPDPNPVEVDDVKILRKEITPIVALSDYTYLYDGGFKEPKVTVKDVDHVTVLLDTEYAVTYTDNRNVGTAKVTVTDKPNGNYELTEVEVEFQITSRTQETLSITQKPNTITYGDKFTLSTDGGSGSGDVTWKITSGEDVATVDRNSGQITVIGHGSATVQATKSGLDTVPATRAADGANYKDATASWTFTAVKKPVTATVTADDKSYDGNDTAAIHAVVEQGVLPGDKIEFIGLTGTFNDANAGVGKTVTVPVGADGKPEDINGQPVTITGNNSEHYDVSYSSLTVKATIHKAVVNITTVPSPASLTYDGTAQALLSAGAGLDTTGVSVEYALSEAGPYSTATPEGTNAGKYTVWYRIQETDNYTGLAPARVEVEIGKKTVTPTITLSGDGLKVEADGSYSYIYDGNAKEPVVTLTEPDGTIPADEYTVSYSSNINVSTSATVTVTAKADGNYSFIPGSVVKTFTIQKERAAVLAAPEAAGDPLTFNTRAQKLVTAGTGSGGTMVYSKDNVTFTDQIPAETDADVYTVYYKVEGDDNHSDSDVGSVTVTIAPKTVKDPTIELELLDDDGNPLTSFTYDGKAKTPTVKVLDGSTLIDPKEYNLVYEDNIDAGKGTVNITDKPGGNYTVTGSATFVIVKADIVFNPAPSAAAIVYDGKAHELLKPGTTSGGEVLYALNSPTSTYTAAIPQAALAGDYTVYYKVVGDKNHNDLNDLTTQKVDVTIRRKPLTAITIELSPEGFEYDGTVKMPEVTVKDGRTVLPEEEYICSCAPASPSNVGTYTITISDAAGGNYDLTGAANNTATFNIGQIAQEELVIGGKPTVTNYGDNFKLSVSGGSSDGAVTWKATGPVTVGTDGTVTINGVGEVTVTVEKAADTNYLSAQAQWTFTAAPMSVTASVMVADKPYDGNTTATVTSASISVISGDTVTIVPGSITAAFDTPAVGAGKTVTLDASKVEVTGDDADKYEISYPDTVTAEITRADTKITTNPASIAPLTYNGQPQALVTAGVTNVGFLVYSLDGTSFSPEIPTGTNAGAYNIYYKVDGTADYTGLAVNATPISVTVSPKPITPVIELSGKSYLYDGTKKDPKITVKDDKTVIDGDQYTVTWAGNKSQTPAEMLTVVDTYTAAIENVAGGNYTFSETITVEIVAAEQDALHITGTPDHVYYGDTVATLDTTGGSANGAVTWSITDGGSNSAIDPATGKLTVKDTGSITVEAKRTVANYGTVSDTWTFTVEPKPVTAEVTIAPKDYDGTTDIADANITAAVKSSDLAEPADSISITGLKGAYDDANAGTNKPVTLDDTGVNIAADTAKYTVSIPAVAQADITPKQVTVTVTLSDHDLQTDANGWFYAYDGTEKKPAVTVTGVDGDYSATLAASDYTVSYAGNKNTGTAAVTVKSAAGGNYTFADETVKFEIRNSAAVLTSTPQAKDLTYDGTAQELVAVGTATGGTVMYSDTGTDGSYSENIPKGTTAGTYTVYYMVKGDANHDDTVPSQVSVVIKRREITPKITLNPTSYAYDGTAHEPTVTVEDGNDTIATTEYTLTYRDNTNAGAAAVIVSDANGGNYIVNGTATFEITKAAPAFTAPEGKTGLQYNGAPQELVKAGVSGDGTVVYSVNGGNFSPAIPTATAVGTYTIDYKVLGDANHSDTDPKGLDAVEIKRNTVTTPAITLSSDTFRFNGGQQKPTITVCDDNGLLIPEHEYTVKIEGTNGNVGMVDVDIYTVTVTTPPTSNYDIQGNNTRTFEIVQGDQETISITGTQAQVRYGDTIQLGVTGGTGSGTVTWTVTDANGNAVNSTINATGLLAVNDVGGPFTVTVTRSKGGNYKDVSATWEFSAAKKQVTAVVTADDRPYAAGDKTATVHASVPGSELVSGDSITIANVTGTFDDPNAGTNKKVTVDSTNPTVTGNHSDRYDITYPAATTASILAEAATVGKEPTPNTLTYDAGQAQALVTAGTVTGGIMLYSLDGANFTAAIPTAKDAGTYTVYFKAQGDGNHTDSAVGSKLVTINKQTVTPQIELTPPSAQYDGTVKRPEVTLRDGANNVIPASEYKVTYGSDNGENWTEKGTYKVKVEDITGGNYIVAEGTETFTISATAQNPLEIVNKPGLVYYGDTFTLSAVGGSGNAAVTWSVDNAGVVEIDTNGFVKIIGTGSAVIKATKPGGTNYDAVEATYPLNALKKPVTAVVTAEDRVYASGNTSATIHVAWKDGDLVGDDAINIAALTGTFADDSVGTNKTVTIKGGPINSDKYDVKLPDSVTASILKADTAAPNVTANNRDYDGAAQPLVTGGNANTRYSDVRDGVYSAAVPTGTDAGTYTVWYKELGDANHNDSVPQAATVTISPKKLALTTADITLSGNDLQKDANGWFYAYDGTEKKPAVTIMDGAAVVPASEYTVTYSGNKNVGQATVTITSNAGGNYTFDEQTVNFTITSATAQLTSSPQAKDLTYTGGAQELVTVGTATGGHIEYSLDGGTTYDSRIPTKIKAGTYTVTYKVVGDGNYADNPDTWTVSVTIKPKEIVSPKVTVTGTYIYDGNPQEPAAADVKVEDGTTVIPADEYAVTFRGNVEAGTATVVITNANGGDYIVNGTGTFTIEKATAAAETDPHGLENLPYNGAAQELVTAGSASGGTMVYSLSKTGEYSPVIPAQTNVGSYTVWYKVQGDGNHNDTDPASVPASIIVNNVVNPTVQVTPESVTFNGKKQEPTVTVIDSVSGLVIDGSEYTVTYKDAGGNATTGPASAGTYTLTITGTGTHYAFTETATFEILPAGQTPLTITGKREHVYYGDTFQLSTEGGNGTVTWKVDDGAPAGINNGLLTITGVGSVTVTATSKANGYEDQTATWPFVVEKKPVTAVVTAAAKTYDGKTAATVTATLQQSDLVGSDNLAIKLSGSFEDPSAGTDKKVTVNSDNPNFDGSTGNHENYKITYPATATASILKADIDPADVTAPAVVPGLVYTGLPQALVTAGSATGGALEYSTDNITYSAGLPTGTDADDYDVWYRVKGDGNHNDTAGTKLADQVTIDPQTVAAPIIEFDPSGASYDGAVHKPAVTVKDNNSRVIPAEEYTVTYGSTDWKTAGNHEVTITGKTDGNYNIATKTETFTISPMGQSPLSITNQPGRVRYGDTFTLSAVGGSGTGAVTWRSSDMMVATISSNGLVTVHKPGSVTITATKLADGNFGESQVSWSFSAEKRPATAIVTADDKPFDGDTSATIHITWKDGDLLSADIGTINLDGYLTGTFNNAAAGNNKTVTITGTVPDNDKYAVTYNTSTTASITPKAATVSGVTAISSLAYTGQPQALVTAGTVNGDGNVMYSLDGGATYSLDVPKAANAGTYTVWYKAVGSGNYVDSVPASVPVTIAPKSVANPTIELSPATFDYDGAPKKPDVVVKDGTIPIPASEYTVSYSNNTQAGTATVTISDAPGGNYNVSGSATFTIRAATASLKDEPQPNSLTYSGFAQELLKPGTAVNGRVVYSKEKDGTYTTSIPTETNAGSYQVWYKVEGENGATVSGIDANPRPKSVTIQPKQVAPTVLVGGGNNYSTPYTGSRQEPALTVIVDDKQLNTGEYLANYSNNTNPGTATVTVQNLGGNYQFFEVTTFEITKAKAEFLLEPEGKTGLVYTGEAQALVEFGMGKAGTVVYSLNGGEFYPFVPEGTEVGSYVVMAKVQGGEFYADSDVKVYRVTIGKNVLTEVDVALSANSFQYTGYEQKPAVTVRDDKNNVISASEYTVTYANNVAVGTASVTVTSTGKNYSFQKTVSFEIKEANQPALAITGKPDAVYYGDTVRLGTTGGSGMVTWAVESGNASSLGNGQFKITGSGSITVKAEAGGSSDTCTLYADPKPVTAVVTAADKPYDTNNTATLTVTVSSGLVSGDTISSGDVTAAGYFTDEKAGTNKTVIITGLTVPDAISAKYDIRYPATTTASIIPAAATVTEEPKKVENLTYTGLPQGLVSPGTAANGTVAYSLDGVNYSFTVPEGTDAKTYSVWYKVVAANENYKDSTPAQVSGVALGVNTVTPSVLCSPDNYRYDGTAKTPTVVVRDNNGHIIPESEYTVTVNNTPAIAVGKYTVTVTDNSGSGNYEFTTSPTGIFEIVAASQNPLTVVNKPAAVHYGDTFRLSATGGSGSGAIKWSIGESSAASIDDNGVVTVTGTGAFTVEAYREASDGYSKSNTDSVPFDAKPKPVTPTVTAEDRGYDGTTDATLHASWKPGDLVGNDTITLTVTGAFATSDAGTNKQVNIQSHTAIGANADKYAIIWPDSTTASIYKVDAKLETEPQAIPGLTYDGKAHPLVTGGKTVGGIGTIVYSTSQNGAYSENIPTGTGAGKYSVWYKVADSVNYTEIDAAVVEVEIAKATPNIGTAPTASGTAGQKLSEITLIGGTASGISNAGIEGTFTWKNDDVAAENGILYDVIFTPDDSVNYKTVTCQVIAVQSVTNDSSNSLNSIPVSRPDTPDTSSAPTQTTIQNGTASTVVSAADGSKLVREAVANQSRNVVIKPEITSDVTKAQVSIPSSTVSQLSSATDAALTVSSPIADVTISNAALDTLSQAGGNVSVVAEKAEQSVVVTLAAGGEIVEQVPGGLTLTVPAEDAGPGTVAVLVHDDGTRETVRKSVVEDGVMSIPLSGSATVEIVDNSKEFADVSPESWEADAVAFASAHELFSGTSETTFSPDQAMSRGMLATVLYRLDGSPELDLTEAFQDVSSEAWYAEGVAWAVENGIAGGYGGGQFGPDDSITREQFVVMLWRYAGSPESSSQVLDFADADQVNGYAQEALCWAVEKGIVHGVGNGTLDPGGTATRAQAAQLLKNFMENT